MKCIITVENQYDSCHDKVRITINLPSVPRIGEIVYLSRSNINRLGKIIQGLIDEGEDWSEFQYDRGKNRVVDTGDYIYVSNVFYDQRNKFTPVIELSDQRIWNGYEIVDMITKKINLFFPTEKE